METVKKALKEYYKHLRWLRKATVHMAMLMAKSHHLAAGGRFHITGSVFLERDDQGEAAVFIISRYGKSRVGPTLATFDGRTHAEFLAQMIVTPEFFPADLTIPGHSERLQRFNKAADDVVELSKAYAERFAAHNADAPECCYFYNQDIGVLHFDNGLRGEILNHRVLPRLNGQTPTKDFRFHLEFLQLLVVEEALA